MITNAVLHLRFITNRRGNRIRWIWAYTGRYNVLIVGVWYRGIPLLKHYNRHLQNNESVVLLMGWKHKNLSIGYSFDFTVSKLTISRTLGSHELNITYLFNWPPKRRKRMRRIPCPHFYK